MPGKLAPYEQEIIALSAEGITYTKIHEIICANGYAGIDASLRMFMQKERVHRKSISSGSSEP